MMLASERDSKPIEFISLQPDPQFQTPLLYVFMAYEDRVYLISNSFMKMNNSGISKYQNIALMKYPDDRTNYYTFINVFKYFIETEAL